MANEMSRGMDDAGIDHRDDTILRALAPDAFGPYGFDSHRADLLVRGMFLPHSLKEALAKRVEEELTDRAAARFAKSLDMWNEIPTKHTKQKTKHTPSPVIAIKVQSDSGAWTEEKTRALVQLHAQRVPFKDIAVQIKGKQVKGCQEHFYRVVKVDKWKQLHHELREEHDAK
ncbi:hypothetical protein N0V93_005318 [Gnomoniopsis smithogilvyi]|uniref:Myb-like domain-containing protein n=1 Tax=Gnomoniopsis smithogilvyi TaxID=1191159 RepID=A0A9W9CX09_9PEZI|nr:hypothetical protein N0V93_005318 [Gnomoniopsis smithogilvyi]